MKKIILLNCLILLSFSCVNTDGKKSEEREVDNSQVDKEEWISLFTGENLDKWDIKITGHEVGENYNNTFRVEDSMIRVSYDDYDNFNGSFGHLYSKKPYSYYKLKTRLSLCRSANHRG